MVTKTKIRAIGNGQGVTIPKHVLKRIHLAKGDEIYLVETAQGLLLTAYDPEFSEAMSIYKEVSHKHRDVLKELAK